MTKTSNRYVEFAIETPLALVYENQDSKLGTPEAKGAKGNTSNPTRLEYEYDEQETEKRYGFDPPQRW